jgi:hypothetical protein
MKREAGGQGEFSVGRIFGAATPPGARQDFGAQRDLKISVTLRTAVLQVPSKSYENRRERSAFVQLSRNQKKSR